MEDIKREELISAYLDGELNATEAARAEQWIAEDPQAKKLFEDLKFMQDAIHQLPRHPLESDLTRGVLDQITDYSVGSESQSQHLNAFIAASRSEESPIIERSIKHEMVFAKDMSESHEDVVGNLSASEPPQVTRRRIYLWPAMAVAAAVLLLIFSRPEQREQDGLVVQRDASAKLKNLPPQQGAIESIDVNAIELSVESRAEKRQISNDRAAGESIAHARGNYQSMKEVAHPYSPAEDTAQNKESNSLELYTFGVAPSLDLNQQVEDLTKDVRQIGLIKLSESEQGELTRHIFELSGDEETIDKVLNTLKFTAGIRFLSRKIVSYKEMEKEQATTLRLLRKKFDLSSTESGDAQTVPRSIHIIFVVPSS